MEKEVLDIINFIEKNPLTKLSNTYNSKFLEKIKSSFTESQQRIFVSSFYCYLNYNSQKDFVIDFDSVWKWLGFSRKDHCKVVLEKYFTKEIDYKINLREQNIAPEVAGVKKERGGYNKEQILLTINTFKKLCLKSNTKKADEIHTYFIKLEEIFQEILNEESNELRNQLLQKEKQLIENEEKSELEKEILLEKTLLNQFPVNTQCIYYGKIDNKDTVGGTLVKFGMSNNLQERIKTHKKTYLNFRLNNVFKVSNQIEIENCIKKHPILKNRIRNIMIDGMNYRELIYIDSNKKDPLFSLEKLEEYIKEIINENQYNIENYNRLLEKNSILEYDISKLHNENTSLKDQIQKLEKRFEQFTPTQDEKKLLKHNKIETSGGYSLFAFFTQENRYKIKLCKTATIETYEKVYKSSNPNGEMKLHVKLKHPFIEKIIMYLLKRHLIFLNNDTFDGSLEDIKMIFDINIQLENLLINNDLCNINKVICGVKGDQTANEHTDPEVPFIRKAKRSIDQIDKDTGKILNTYASIEAAGRSLGLTTGTAIGVALRNITLCKGFLWRYSGISKEDQMLDQPVIRINCNTGEKKNYQNIASAAKDAKISPPGLRNRILTDLHYNNFHWVFDKSSTHYN